MLFVENTIEEKIISMLSKGSYNSPDLISKISFDMGVTPQGVYKSLSYLIDKEIINKNKKSLSLNNIWIEKLRSFSEKVSENYSLKDFDDYLLLDDKEKITYNFKNAVKLDNQWLHFVLIISKRLKNKPVFIWNPHHWFILGRSESEKTFFSWFNKEKRDVFVTIGDNTELDKFTMREIKTDNVHVNLDSNFSFSNSEYITVIGDYILTTKYSEDFNKKIDEFFDIRKEVNLESKSELFNIIKKPQKTKIILERNKKKAIKYSKIMSKDFYLNEEIRKNLN